MASIRETLGSILRNKPDSFYGITLSMEKASSYTGERF
jgi:hypothetical protein